MKFILIVFLFTTDPNGPVGIQHKIFPSKDACESAEAGLKETMKLPPNVLAASKCISEKDLLEYNLA